jgi:hypothetical protein
MNRLDINFVGRGRSPWPARVLVGVALALSLDLASSYRELRGAIELNEARLARAEPRGAPRRSVTPEELAAVRETLDRLAMPWERLFKALEAAASDEVALLGIEPDPKSGSVVISGDGKDYLAALTYVLNLGRSEALSRVQLVRHERKSNDPQGAVSFTVSANWSEPRP